ncbi:MAG: tRNA (adenosine(37)-N6)-threonylcarbamoyltransferase complex transferase subunit TsaD [Bacteroidia bacterium]
MPAKKSIHNMTQKQDTVTLLAIESSCDDTAAAVIRNCKILANIVSSQEIHQLHGGVVPELASRAHLQYIVPVVMKALETAGISAEELDGIAYTQGPGLMGSLLVGSHFAKGMAMGLEIPTMGINHLQAHVAAHYLGEKVPNFPYLCLLVSGGHTQILLVKSHLEMEIIGSTLDDAAGEAFDKTAKMLGLDYPGGPLVDKLAEQGNPLAYKFPIAKIEGYGFSFSGLKTSVLYFLQKEIKKDKDFIENNLNDICASVRYTIVKGLLDTFERAASDYGIKDLCLAGGVSANRLLRRELIQLTEKHGWNYFIPAFEYCTDNAAMIAIAGHYKFIEKEFTPLDAMPYAR